MITYVFPGQGSQNVGMGKELFDEFPEIVKKADEILGYSIKDLCLEDREGNINNTQYSQPALFTVNAMMYYKRIKENGIVPDYVAGHSLGEYNALLAAEVFDFETGLKLVKKRGELMGQAKNGAMAAVIGLGEDEIVSIIRDEKLDLVDVANYNSPAQTVISSTKDEIERLASLFEEKGARYVPLKVSAAFHSRYMTAAMEEFGEYAKNFEFHEPKIKIISNVTARPYKNSKIRETLVPQINSSVKWSESIRFLMGRGDDMEFIQIGPGNVLNGLIRNIKKDATPIYDEEEIEIVTEENIDLEELNTNQKAEDAISLDFEGLGNPEFAKRYNAKMACVVGAMQMGISSAKMIGELAKAGIVGFLGTAGLSLDKLENELAMLIGMCSECKIFGANVTYTPRDPYREQRLIELLLKYEINVIEASGFIKITEPLALYKIKGLSKNSEGLIDTRNKIILKVSRTDILKSFLEPIPEKIIKALYDKGLITSEQAKMASEIPLVDDICALADSAGATDMRTPYAVLPSFRRMVDDLTKEYGYKQQIFVGQAGGIGSPEAVVAAIMLGADFVETGSINQCTVEANTSDAVKDLLASADIQDTDYVVSGVFEYGGKVQVLKKGNLFFARLNKMYEIYRQCNSLEEIDEKQKSILEKQYLKKNFEDVFEDVLSTASSSEKERLMVDSKYKMGSVLGWYSSRGFSLALEGDKERCVDFHINCSPAMGAFNHYVKDSELETWKNRTVVKINTKLMKDAFELMRAYISRM